MMKPRYLSPLSALWLLLSLASFGLLLPPAQAAEISVPDGLKLTAPHIPEKVTGATRELNVRLSEGVKPVNNAAVHLTQLLGDGVFAEPLRAISKEMLGIETLASDAPRFLYIQTFVQLEFPQDQQKRDAMLKQFTTELQSLDGGPWQSSKLPVLGQFFDANNPALDRLVEIADLSQYYAPVLSTESPGSLIAASFTLEYRLPYLGQCLHLRAMRRLADGDFEGASTDLLAIHKLAYLLAEGSPLDVSMAKAQWIDSNAYKGEVAMLQSGLLSAEQAQQYLKQLNQLPPMPSPIAAADIGERLVIQQEIELLRDSDAAMYAFFDWDPAERQKDLAALREANLDWDLAFQEAKQIQDEAVAALAITDFEDQMKEIVRLNEIAKAWRDEENADDTPLVETLDTKREAASRLMGKATAMALRANLWQRVHTHHRGIVRRDMAKIGLALVAYQKEHGDYPKQLSDLTPQLLEKVPLDVHSGQPFGYEHRGEEGIRLFSLGANRVPDQGDWRDDDVYLDLK